MEYGRCLLAQCLDNAGLRQQDLADKIGVDKRQISAYIRGTRKMSLLSALTIAQALYCEITDLYEFPGYKRNP